MNFLSILANVNAGVNSNIASNSNQTISTSSSILEKNNLDLWLVFFLGIFAGVFFYWIFLNTKRIKSENKKDKLDKNTKKDQSTQEKQEGD